MRWLIKILRKLAWWLNPTYKNVFVPDPPEALVNKTVYIVGHTGNAWMLSFKCPCGCKNPVQLNLLKEANPRWKFRIIDNKIDIVPSIWRTEGCKSHFILRRGKIIWS